MKSQISSKANIHPTSWIKPEDIIIKEGVEIGPFCCIGSDSLSVEREFPIFGNNKKQKSRGGVIIKKNSILTNFNSVNCALKEGENTIIENNVMSGTMNVIGHDSIIGENTILISHVTITGHVTIGKNCWIGPGSIIRNRVKIGDKAQISMGTVVTQDVEQGKHVTGNFAIDHETFLKNLKDRLAR
jgi:UDP-3-O-[3-hydroxymyristoyl] glucosamine N-acyltransferase